MQAMLEKYKKINRKGKPTGAPSSAAAVAGHGSVAQSDRPVEDDAPKHPMHSVLSRVRAAVKEEAATTVAAAAAHAVEVVPSSSGLGGSSLAILVLIIDEFPHEALWRLWLQRGSAHERGRVRFLFHAKFPDRVRSPWVKERLVDFSFRPQWGSVEITKAMFALLRRAVRDDDAKVEEGVGVDAAAGGRLSKFAFASESCVPVVPLTEALARVFTSNHGWMRLKAKANNGYSQNKQFDVLRGKLPADCICKADQWVLLNRRQALDLLRLPSLVEAHEHTPSAAAGEGVHTSSQPLPLPLPQLQLQPQPEKPSGKEVRIERAPPGLDPHHWRGEKKLLALFSKVGASDEMFLPTCLALLGHVTVTPGAGGKAHRATAAGVELDDRPLTYFDWENNPTNPTTFHSLTTGLARERNALATAHKARCIFFRKLKMDPHRSPPTSLPHGPEQSPHEHVALDWFRVVYPSEDEGVAVEALRKVYVEVRTGKRAVAAGGGDSDDGGGDGGGGTPSNKRMRR